MAKSEPVFFEEYEAKDGLYQVEIFQDGSYTLCNSDMGICFEGSEDESELEKLEDEKFAVWVQKKLIRLEKTGKIK